MYLHFPIFPSDYCESRKACCGHMFNIYLLSLEVLTDLGFLNSFSKFIFLFTTHPMYLCDLHFLVYHASYVLMWSSLYDTGGRDDAKISIPTTVVLRYMFTPAEMRVDVIEFLLCPWYNCHTSTSLHMWCDHIYPHVGHDYITYRL